MPRFEDPVAALARDLDRYLEGDLRNPGRDFRNGRGAVIAQEPGRGRVGALPGRDPAGYGDGPLRAGDIQVGIIKEGGQGERPQIPGLWRPFPDGGLVEEKALDLGAVESPYFVIGQDLRGLDGLGLIADAARSEERRRKESQAEGSSPALRSTTFLRMALGRYGSFPFRDMALSFPIIPKEPLLSQLKEK